VLANRVSSDGEFMALVVVQYHNAEKQGGLAHVFLPMVEAHLRRFCHRES